MKRALRVLRSGSSPERRRGRAGPALVAAALALALACSRSARSVRLPAFTPGDEIHRISCEDTIGACRDEAERVCGARYEVLESTGAPVEPVRVSSAPGPASTGPRYQRKKWLGQMVVACGRAGPPPSLAAEPAPSPATGAPRAAAAPGAAPPAALDRLCVPGATQECLGPGACRGAQACLADGDGYGPCDCGNGSTGAQRSPARYTHDTHDAGPVAPDVAGD